MSDSRRAARAELLRVLHRCADTRGSAAKSLTAFVAARYLALTDGEALTEFETWELDVTARALREPLEQLPSAIGWKDSKELMALRRGGLVSPRFTDVEPFLKRKRMVAVHR